MIRVEEGGKIHADGNVTRIKNASNVEKMCVNRACERRRDLVIASGLKQGTLEKGENT